MPIQFPILIVGLVILLALGVRIVREGERLAVSRLGVFVSIRGPGVTFTLPFLDKTTRIVLDRDIPGWRSLPNDRLVVQVRRISGV